MAPVPKRRPSPNNASDNATSDGEFLKVDGHQETRHVIRGEIMRAYVQQLQRGDISYFSFEQHAYWFEAKNYEVVRFDYPQLDEGFLDRGLLKYPEETIVVGGVRTIREALLRAGRPLPVFPSLPESLRPWVGREFWTTTFGEICELIETKTSMLPLHLKPNEHEKLFTGKVICDRTDLARLGTVPDEEQILVQQAVEFRSEWRAYVFRGRIVHVARYLDDPLLFPDSNRLREALAAFANPPISYSMDWGITSEGETVLVEVNDGMALGNYGLSGEIHSAMIEARWRELMGLPDNGVGERFGSD